MAKILPNKQIERLKTLLHPVRDIGHTTQVRQRSLGPADSAFDAGQLVGHRDEELAVALALVAREGEDTCGGRMGGCEGK